MEKRYFFVLSALLFAGISCVSDEACRYYLKHRLPSKDVSEVEILYKEPQDAYIVIADFQAYGATPKHMRKRAAEIGADAVIIVGGGGLYSPGEVWADRDQYSHTYTRLLGTAIKYGKE